MNREIWLLLHSLGMGVLLTVIYDGLQILRKLFPHGNGWISAEDLIFWSGSGLYVFCRIYQENDGIVRFYVFAGVLLGCFLWKATAENIFVTISLKILELLVKFLVFWAKRLLFLGRRGRIQVCKCKEKFFRKHFRRNSDGERTRNGEAGRKETKSQN